MNARMMVTLVFLYLGVAVAQQTGTTECTSSGHNEQCASDTNAVVLLQTKLQVTAAGDSKKSEPVTSVSSVNKNKEEIALDAQGEVKAHATVRGEKERHLLSGRNTDRRRRKSSWLKKAVKSVKKTVSKTADTVADAADTVTDTATDVANTVADTATDVADAVSDYYKEATDQAQAALDTATEALESTATSTLRKLIPSCLSEGDITDCLPSVATSWINKRVTALESGFTSFSSCFSSNGWDIKDLTKIITDIECDDTTKIVYPSGIDFDWPPAIKTDDISICTNIGGINTDVMKDMMPKFETCAKDMYNEISSALDSSSTNTSLLFLDGCECSADFGIYMGASASMSAVVEGAMSSGFMVGCDGCNFLVKPFWSFFVGVSSNAGASVGGVIGYSKEWHEFFGEAMLVGASAFGFSVGVAVTVPSIAIKTKTLSIDSPEICIMSQCVTLSQDIPNVPYDVEYTASEFAAVEFGLEFGVDFLPIDVSSGYAVCSEIDLD